MSKYIKMTNDIIDECRREMEKAFKNSKLDNGRFSFSKEFSCNKEKAIINYTPEAFLKMYVLLMNFDIEVGWYGVANRMDEEENEYLISDIVVYPQKVTSCTVEIDETEWAKWMQDNADDDRIYSLYMHGHSHVNMGTSPSATDLKHQKDILDLMSDDGFYIFMIWNKKLKFTASIYDMKKNILFEDNDIKVRILGENEKLEDFLDNAKKIAKKPTSWAGNYYDSKSDKSTSMPYSPKSPYYKGGANSKDKKSNKKKSYIDKSWK